MLNSNIINRLNFEAYEDCFCCPVYGQCALDTCLNCSEGFYNDAFNQSSCKACEIGRFNK
jgi:hypothetical protein